MSKWSIVNVPISRDFEPLWKGRREEKKIKERKRRQAKKAMKASIFSLNDSGIRMMTRQMPTVFAPLALGANSSEDDDSQGVYDLCLMQDV